ncbi:MAG: VWA domain-containing protein [Lautropia sp.]|nr:VWA domain-containing protein [Lautropia sp.]
MSSLKKFTIASPRPLPVFILADTSGSMAEDGKIHALNDALKDMLSTFSDESRQRAEIQVAVITFGGQASLHQPLSPAHELAELRELVASGSTPMGAAFSITRQLLEDKEVVPSRAYRPALVLISDGLPTDDWKGPLHDLACSERGQKATRFAMAIGEDADEEMLKEFANDREAPLFKAHDARGIHAFFRAVTMSVSRRLSSQNPEESGSFVIPPPDDLFED